MIQKANLADVQAIASIHVTAWREAYAGIVPQPYLDALSIPRQVASWIQQVQSPEMRVIVHWHEGEITGFAAGGRCRDADAGAGVEAPSEDSEIYAIYSLQKFWRRGFGRRLIQGMEDQLAGAPRIRLWVLEKNVRAIQFYQNAGYARDGAAKLLPMGGETLNEIRLSKTLR